MSFSLSSMKLVKPGKAAVDQLRKAAAAATEVSRMEFTRFRVFGKFRNIDDALNLFRQVCAVEKTAGLQDGQDCSRFAIYKEDEMTMALENFPSDTVGPGVNNVSTAQFSAADLPHATGQRFACVSVSLQPTGATCVEAVVVHVYQCFPTPQSAVRFARHVAATLLAPSALSIVPLFEWIALTELERNCNTYADVLCQLLLNKSIPAYVNRAAYFGSFLSCLMPADMTDQAPVGDPNGSSRLTNSAPRRSDFVYTPFAGALPTAC
ncbi:hypothetical protein BBO99_00002553 [Phytophthora kernoviae]|uniref:PPPDE domain-containing protein n=2 Tax=Phytophthora kernoviae TaxID=325452 RepID=A0A3R7H0A6_9STRA|nr:hypothetical protein G195_004323 [Phytophthora kernoviae 00238/432]KAG2527314.1 hypothetical protein JM16_003494 [Phytophthora kernoviae]KAG2530330.1 hypothetical protein JM18_002240 [Phytophthora kernoviae]RLN20956.1 hypothetical protein BBI17_002452 [Phytophthora kernoviae]RLN82864.1 hypothetical protein BBO99_00002553 [Phytophthora kernoviae]